MINLLYFKIYLIFYQYLITEKYEIDLFYDN